MYSIRNQSWGRVCKNVERIRAVEETSLAKTIFAEEPGVSWGEALRRSAAILDGQTIEMEK